MADKRIKITCDDAFAPSYISTKIIDAETGEDLPNVRGVDIHIDVREETTATLHILSPALDIEVNANLRCAHCGQDLPEVTING